MPKLSDKEWDELFDIVEDAVSCPRLTEWEDKFIKDMHYGFFSKDKEIDLSEKQIATIRKIGRTKVYLI